MTVPSILYQWPSICAASSGRPSAIAFLMEVEENVPLLSATKGAIVTPKPNFFPKSINVCTDPALFFQKQKSAPTTICFTLSPLTRTSVMNWTALRDDKAELNCNS